jgi:hypothetical protein
MIVRNSQGVFYSNLGNNQSSQISNLGIGKVFHIVADSNSPGFNDWSNIGDIYYVGVNEFYPSEEDIQDRVRLSQYIPAKPYLFSSTFYPVKGEIVSLITGPSKSTTITGQNQIYYLPPINLYNNINHNSQVIYNIDDNGNPVLGRYITEKNTRNPLVFEGDNIINSRWGASLRFGSTLKANEGENWWSTSGINGDPITLLVNGYNIDKEDISPYLENINNDDSSIYLTSTQTISNFNPLRQIDQTPFSSIISPSTYGNKSQLLLSSNRITLNSSKDELLLYATTNIEAGANVIHLNGQEAVYINSPKIFLGNIKNNSLDPTINNNIPQPALMGYDTQLFLSKLLNILNKFASDLTIAVSSPAGSAEISVTVPAAALQQSLDSLRNNLNDILSDSTYISR